MKLIRQDSDGYKFFSDGELEVIFWPMFRNFFGRDSYCAATKEVISENKVLARNVPEFGLEFRKEGKRIFLYDWSNAVGDMAVYNANGEIIGDRNSFMEHFSKLKDKLSEIQNAVAGLIA